jgi:hypothetical protein
MIAQPCQQCFARMLQQAYEKEVNPLPLFRQLWPDRQFKFLRTQPCGVAGWVFEVKGGWVTIT